MFKRMSNTTKIAILCLVLGLIAFFMGNNAYKKTSSFVETTATITRVEIEYKGGDTSDKTHVAYVNYRVNGRDYNDVRLDYYENGYEKGKVIPLFYNPQDPTDITGVTLKSAKMFMTIGIVVTLMGVAIFGKRIITGR